MSALLEARMDQTVTLKAFAGYNAYGDASFSTASATHQARVEGVQRLVKGPDGRDTLATTRVFVGTSTASTAPSITIDTQVTLPDGTKPPILAVDTHRKLSGGTDHQVVYFG